MQKSLKLILFCGDAASLRSGSEHPQLHISGNRNAIARYSRCGKFSGCDQLQVASKLLAPGETKLQAEQAVRFERLPFPPQIDISKHLSIQDIAKIFIGPTNGVAMFS